LIENLNDFLKGTSKVEQQSNRMIPVFGRWQTEPYKPPVAKNVGFTL